MSLSISVAEERPTRFKADLVVIPVVGQRQFGPAIPKGLAQDLTQAARKHGFTGAWSDATLLVQPPRTGAAFVAVVGLGGSDESSERMAEGLRRGVASVIQDARRLGLKEVAVNVAGLADAGQLAQAVAEGASLANYRFTKSSAKLAKQDRQQAVRKLTVLTDSDNARAVRAGVREARQVLPGVLLARDLVNQPADTMSPKALVETARTIARESEHIAVKVFDRARAAKENFTAFLAVARGSDEEPYVIHLTYRPEQSTAETKKVVVVGKGITFDSGGLSIKPAEYMETMKVDMAGSAAVLGLFASLEAVQPDVEVHGIIAACENMPSGTAYRPGDVVTAKNGTTIEVLNTDAEGRVTLADALSYAVEQEPDAVIDLATLTGACVVALGENVAGLWSNDDALTKDVIEAATTAGEAVTHMPMPIEYRKQIDSQVADLRNIATTRYGGAITAALFLHEFVGKTPWVHLDIAGPAYAERPLVPYAAAGGSGWGVRTLVNFLRDFEQEKSER